MAKLSEIQESFSSTLDATKWDITNIVAVNGRGVMTPPEYQQCELLSKTKFDAANSMLSAKLTPTTLPPGVQAVVAQIELSVRGVYNAEFFGNEHVSIQASGHYNESEQVVESLTLTRHASWQGPTPSYINIPYNRTNHAYVRMRFSGADVFLETSPNGKNWTSHGSIKHTLTDMNVNARVFYLHGQQQPAYVDDVNIIPSSGQFLQFF